MSPEVYFRDFTYMPEAEIFAMDFCEGKILDVGAGVGAHALYLQDMEKEVHALEISKVSSDIMRKRGVNHVINADFFRLKSEVKYDTLLFMMNGIGLTGTVDRLDALLHHARTLIHPNGAIIFDSSDVAYLWEKERLKQQPYYGEVTYRYQYGDKWGHWFQWLYIDIDLMKQKCNSCGWDMQVLFEDETDHYLARLTMRS